MGIVTPIYKKEESKKCSNYRAITLTSTAAKVYRPKRGVNDASRRESNKSRSKSTFMLHRLIKSLL